MIYKTKDVQVDLGNGRRMSDFNNIFTVNTNGDYFTAAEYQAMAISLAHMAQDIYNMKKRK